MKIINTKEIEMTLAHNTVPRKSLIKVGDSKSKLQTVNDAYLEPGMNFKPHIHTDCEEVYYFLDGEGEMLVNDNKIQVNKGTCILVEAGESHGLINTGSTRLRFITVRILL